MIPYAAVLRAAEHEVRVASSAAFTPAVEPAGFALVPVGPDLSWANVEEKFPGIVAAARRGKEFRYSAELTWTQWNLAAAGDLLAAPRAASGSSTMTPRRRGTARRPSPGCRLPGSPAPLGRERPFVYATLGTVFNRQRKLRQAVIDGLSGLDADVLLTVGGNVDPDTVGPVPGNLRVERFLPQSLAMARASPVVSHAGLGTMLGAIYHRVPMVPLVLGAEHPINAASAEEAGLALPLTRPKPTRTGSPPSRRGRCGTRCSARGPKWSARSATTWSRSTGSCRSSSPMRATVRHGRAGRGRRVRGAANRAWSW
ncbi:glycosyltransferase [Amycolatopsis jiangsuensis]|uniref:UDP:flavonoid glycosyltransferase YjiC (YdhE family) n=1 Tax=Amycolatopsis jiangsuensis TaxID=1181879 RepID=A0A840IQC6_9PSEU|nr:nucleotide disphospho-sugar-binding domain-containing protein [Amycolatopsis jiangsuensis]MBB4683655.1 UDP:flavonoid glycosyltransferase YjiC (YdhE family) [Amycolatopsis jiangsuensis]